MAFAFYTAVSVDHTKVGSSDSTDFPVLVSVTDARFATVSNGGHVQNANGYDIRPYADSGAVTARDYKLVSYNATTGTLIMRVRQPTLSHTVDPVIYLFYGDASISTDGSSASNTYSNNFAGAYPLEDNAASTAVVGFKGSNGTTVNNTSGMSVAGKVGKALQFTAANGDALDFGGQFSATGGEYTLSYWLNPVDTPSSFGLNIGTDQVMFLSHSGGNWDANNHRISFLYSIDGFAATHYLSSINSVPAGSMTKITLTFSAAGSVSKGYINGALDLSDSFGSMRFNSVGDSLTLMARGTTHTNAASGILDEWTLATAIRSADWILAEYNNENSPSTFLSFGTEQSTGGTIASGTGLALSPSQALALGVAIAFGGGSAASASLAYAVGAAIAAGSGNAPSQSLSRAAGASIASGAGLSLSQTLAAAAGAVIASGSGVSFSTSVATGNSSAIIIATGTAASVSASSAFAAALAIASGTGVATSPSAAAAAGSSIASGVGNAPSVSVAIAFGASFVFGTGASQSVTYMRGVALGTATVPPFYPPGRFTPDTITARFAADDITATFTPILSTQ